jgi:hypothetical protein
MAKMLTRRNGVEIWLDGLFGRYGQQAQVI